jgi:5-methyltetrahydropteroyltriglutamate--homocysteine methyltransferase
MMIPTEPIGSIPRPAYLVNGIQDFQAGDISQAELDERYVAALRDTIEAFEISGSPVVTDGEQTKASFVTYPIEGSDHLAADGVVIPFADGHTRRLPTLTSGPFRYQRYADHYLQQATQFAHVPVKQSIIAPSALSLLYPEAGIEGYAREAFLADLVNEPVTEIRRCLAAGAHKVQLDFTEGRLSLKLDPTGDVLRRFIELNNAVLGQFSPEDQARIGVHTCPGGDLDSTHSLDVDYADLLPGLFQLRAGNFYVQLASEPDPARVLRMISDNLRPGVRVFVGVIDPIDPRVESQEVVRDRVLEAARYIPPDQLGSCDDCGFAPFGDDLSTSRDIAFAKINARVLGTGLAAEQLTGLVGAEG